MGPDDGTERLDGRRAAPGRRPRASKRELLRDLSDLAWRLLVLVAVGALLVYALSRLVLVLLPVFVALLLTTLLVPPATWLRARGWGGALATWTVLLGFLLGLALFGLLIVPAITSQVGDLRITVSEGVTDVEEWLVEGPVGLSRAEVRSFREEATQRAREFAGSSGGTIVDGAVVVFEVIAGAVLALVLAFFFVKDGHRFQGWALQHLPPEHRDVVRASAGRAWTALGAYLRGAAVIGLLEGVVIAIALAVLGSSLAVPVGVLTFLAAFFPVVGAVVAGVVAVLVALVTGGVSDAVIMAVVALLLQQFDNDLLAPLVYGRIVKLHPVVVLLALTAGGTLAGIIGAFLAVPLAAMAGAVGGELWIRRYGPPEEGDVFDDDAGPAAGAG